MCKIEFKTGGAAFRNEDGTLNESEVAFQVRDIATKIEEGFTSGPIMDMNGNNCGKWFLGEDN